GGGTTAESQEDATGWIELRDHPGRRVDRPDVVVPVDPYGVHETVQPLSNSPDGLPALGNGKVGPRRVFDQPRPRTTSVSPPRMVLRQREKHVSLRIRCHA